MRTETIEPAGSRTQAEFRPARTHRPPPRPAPTRRRRLDWFELAVLVAFACVSVWVLALDLWQVVVHDRIWTGTDGFFLIDQMQYVAWIRDASHHVLASNLFVLRATPADYFQPGVAISGAIAALGVAPWLALLLWKPVAVLAAFFAIRAYAHRTLGGLWERRAALVLGLFFGSFGVIGDMWMGWWSWGYPFGLLAIAAELGALVCYDRARRAGRIGWAAPLLGALAASLHPWQGETLILIVVAAELLMRDRGPRRFRLPLATVIATSIPLAYYAILTRADLAWELARSATRHSYALTSIALALAPLLIPAALAYRGRPRTFLDCATRIWPLAALVIYVVSLSDLSGTPLHAFAGVTVPLAVLAIQGVRRLNLRRVPYRGAIAALAVAAFTIPASRYELSIAPDSQAPTHGNANFITEDESRALDYLARNPRSGGVLTRFYLGSVVPARTGRRTFVGHCLWSEPGCTPRAQLAQQLFEGSLDPALSRNVVQEIGARFVLADCEATPVLRGYLAPITVLVKRFGCASVYQVRLPGRSS